jgi:hypothetical protein
LIEATYAPPSDPTQVGGPALGLKTTMATTATDYQRQQGLGTRYVLLFVGVAVELMRFWRGQVILLGQSTAPAALTLLASMACVLPPKAASSWAGKCPSPVGWLAHAPATSFAAAGLVLLRPLSTAVAIVWLGPFALVKCTRVRARVDPMWWCVELVLAPIHGHDLLR